jgi:hypothetical protein
MLGPAAGRSGTDGALAATNVLYVLVPSGSGDDFTTPTVQEAAAASRPAEGWMLLALHGYRRQWAMPLLARGAAVTAPPRVAQAVAVRVLADLGVHVRAWHGVGSADQPVYQAELEAPREPAPPHDHRRDQRRLGSARRRIRALMVCCARPARRQPHRSRRAR